MNSKSPIVPNEEATTEVLKQLIIKHVPGLSLEKIDPAASILEEGLGLNSLTLVDFIVLVEKTFGFTFAEEELSMETFSSLLTLAKFIANRQNSSAS
jgi:acyl carrier protein